MHSVRLLRRRWTSSIRSSILALQRLESPRVVDVLLTGTHEPGKSHDALLRAFAPDLVLEGMSAALEREGFRSHEFGDAVLLARYRG